MVAVLELREREEEEKEEERDREGGLRPAAFRFTARAGDVIRTSDITVLEFQIISKEALTLTLYPSNTNSNSALWIPY